MTNQNRNDQTTTPARIPYVGTFANLDAARRALDAAVSDSNRGLINLCSPAAEIDYLPPMRALHITVVHPGDADLYSLRGQKQDQRNDQQRGEDALGIPKLFLDRLIAARGASIVETLRVDDGRTEHFWRWRVTIAFADLAGSVRHVQATREVDLRDGSHEARAALGQYHSIPNLSKARAFGPQVCESKALNRAARAGLPIRGALTREAFARPWIVVKTVPHVDVGWLSTEAKERLAMAALGQNVPTLYGAAAMPAQQPPAAPPPVEDVSDDEPGRPATTDAPMATPEQVAELSRACDALGEEVFWPLGAKTLGYDLPSPAEMTTDEAAAVLAACRKARTAKAQQTQAKPF